MNDGGGITVDVMFDGLYESYGDSEKRSGTVMHAEEVGMIELEPNQKKTTNH